MPAKKKAGRRSASDDKPNQPDALDTNPMRSEQASEASSSSPRDQSLIREGHIASSPTTLAQQPVGTRSAAATLSPTTLSEPQEPAHIDPPASTGTATHPESSPTIVVPPQHPSNSTPRAETAQAKPAPPSSEAAVSSGTPESPKATVAPADAEPPKAEEVAAHSATPLISWSATGLQFTPAQRAAAAAGLPDPGANASTLGPPVSTAGNPMVQAQATSAADGATVWAKTRVASTTSNATADVSSQDVEAAPAGVTTPLTSSAVGEMMEGARTATSTAATPTSAPEVGDATSSHEQRVDATQPASLADTTQTEAPQMPNHIEGTSIGESLRLAGLISADISDDRMTGDGGSRGPFLDAAGSDPTSAFSVDSPTGDVTFKSDIGTHSAFAADTRVSSGGSTGRGFVKEQLEQEATNQQLGIDSGMDYQQLAKQANEDKSLDALDRAEIAQQVGGEPTEADQTEVNVASEATEVVSETPVEDDEPTDGTATAMPNPEDTGPVTPATAEAAAWFLRAVHPDDNTKSSLANPGGDEFGTQSGVHIGALPPDARLSPNSNPDPGDDSALGSADPPTFENTLTNPGPDLGLGGWTPDSGSPNSPGAAVGDEDD